MEDDSAFIKATEGARLIIPAFAFIMSNEEADGYLLMRAANADSRFDRLPSHQKLPTMLRHRRVEDVKYWRQRAGWFDDDEKMKEYNNGVYDTYYQIDDDQGGHRSGGRRRHSDMVKTGLKVVCVLVALVLCTLMFRAIMRRVGSSKKEKKRSDSRSRSGRSKSRSRSRSRSRKTGSDYNLMDDDGDAKSSRSKRSTRSSRSKSKSKRSSSRSRSRNRSRSKSRTDSKEEPASPAAEPVLV